MEESVVIIAPHYSGTSPVIPGCFPHSQGRPSVATGGRATLGVNVPTAERRRLGPIRKGLPVRHAAVIVSSFAASVLARWPLKLPLASVSSQRVRKRRSVRSAGIFQSSQPLVVKNERKRP